MKLCFFLNMMGVASLSWYKENNIPSTQRWSKVFSTWLTIYEKTYCCGRIDVHNHPDHPFNYEFSVGIMDNESWSKFGDWLHDLTLDYLPDSVEEIVGMFEEDTGFKINWWGKDE